MGLARGSDRDTTDLFRTAGVRLIRWSCRLPDLVLLASRSALYDIVLYLLLALCTLFTQGSVW